MIDNCANDAVLLSEVDYNNDEHKFAVQIAVLCAALRDKPLVINCSFRTYLRILIHYRRTSIKWSRKKRGITAQAFLDVLRPGCVTLCGDEFTFGDIYRAFYANGYKEDEI